MSEQELCYHYKMSRNSVRRALDELQKEELVVKRPGLGTMVSTHLASRPSGNKVLRIAVPHPAYFVDYGLPSICEAFSRKYPDVDIHIVRMPATSTFWESVRQAELLGTPPHILLVSDGLLASLTSFQDFLDLGPPLEETAHLYPRIRNAFHREDKLVALPITFTPVFMTFNSGMFEQSGIEFPQADWTTGQFVDAAMQLTTSSEGIINRFGFSLYPSFSRWLVLALQNGMKPNGADNRQIITETLAQLQNWLHRDRFATTYSHVWNMGNPYIYEKAAMSLTTMFEMSSWLDRGIQFTPEIAPLPFGGTKSTLMQTNMFMIPRNNPDLEWSIKFLEVALEDEVQKAFCEKLPFLSVKEKVNTKVKPAELLERINVAGPSINNNYFVHELVEYTEQDDSQLDLHLYWLGLEKAAQIANHF